MGGWVVGSVLYAGFPGSTESVGKTFDEFTKDKRVEILANLWQEEPIPYPDLFEQFP